MKTNKLMAGLLASLVFLSMTAYAQEEAGNSPQPSLQEIAELGSGVHKVKMDGKLLKSCVIVGEARISTVLGLGKGLSVARRNAQLSAEGAFVSWLKTNVSSVRSRGDETVYELVGSGEGNPTQTGNSTETQMEQITSAAQGAIRGMTLIGEYRDSETQYLFRIYAWKQGFADASASVEEAMEPVEAPQQTEPQSQPSSPATPRQNNPGYDSRFIVSPEAAEFL